MSREIHEYLQCVNCGNIHMENFQCEDDDLYIENIKCEHCKKTSKHLRCGDDPSQIYTYYDVVLDERFYKYNTK